MDLQKELAEALRNARGLERQLSRLGEDEEYRRYCNGAAYNPNLLETAAHQLYHKIRNVDQARRRAEESEARARRREEGTLEENPWPVPDRHEDADPEVAS